FHRVAAVIERTPDAPRTSIPIPRVHFFEVTAARARSPDGAADTAVPVLAAPLQSPQRLAALGAHRRRDRRGPRLASAMSRSQRLEALGICRR
ncbi:MAG: hypothetical protein ACRDRD_14395, partial [Pseudonocardiaceae bacterium]